MKKLFDPMVLRRFVPFAAMALGFTLWSIAFIRKTSTLIDGRRYFCLFDDAMVSMRYAWNLSHGFGLVWNPGERVEGITNLLSTLWMAVFTRLFNKSTAVLAVQLTGVVALVALGWFCALIGAQLRRKAGERVEPSAVDFCAALIYYPLLYWSLMGMETGHLALLVAASVWLVIRDRFEPRFSIVRPVVLGLVALVRPDTQPVIAWMIAYRAMLLWHRPGGRRDLARELAITLAFPLVVTLFRLGYYGRWLPNTVLLKLTGVPLAMRLENGMIFMRPFLKTIWLPVAVAALNCVLNASRERVLLFTLFATSLAYQVWVGGDPWPLWRQVAPFVPLLFVLCVDEARGLGTVLFATAAGSRYARRNAIVRPENTLAFFALAYLALQASAGFVQEATFERAPYLADEHAAQLRTGLVLREILGPRATVGVFWAGTPVYYSGLRGIDFLGKCDAYVAALPPDLSSAVSSLPGHNKYDLQYSIVRLQPTYVQQFTWGRQDLAAEATANYRLVQYKGLELWLRTGSPDVRWDRIARGS